MLPLVLILLLAHSIGQISCQGIVFPIDANDSCTLASSGGAGQCRKFSECNKNYSERRNICGYSGNVPIVCCDVLRQQCEGSRLARSKLTDHLVGDVNDAKSGEFPFMALITYNKTGLEADEGDFSQYRCGAALVTKRFLLTAAHCIRLADGIIPYSVKLGTIDVHDTGADTYLISRVHVHHDYKPLEKQNDIGILEVNDEIVLNDLIAPICIYSNPEDLSESKILTVMGWGTANDENQSDKLLKGTVYHVPRTKCQARFDYARLGKRIQLQDTQMCALGDTNAADVATDSCQGDSGGPLVLREADKDYLVAIVSTGSGCGGKHLAGIYTRVNKFLPWIIQKEVFRNH